MISVKAARLGCLPEPRNREQGCPDHPRHPLLPLRVKASRNQSGSAGPPPVWAAPSSPSVLAGGGQSSRQMSLITVLGAGEVLDSAINQRPITLTAWLTIVLFLTYHRKIRLSVTAETPFESLGSQRMGLLLFFYLSSRFEDELFLVLSHDILFFKESALRIQFVKADNHWQIRKRKERPNLSDFIRKGKIKQKV